MLSAQVYQCRWCKRSNFRSQRGLKQHLRLNTICRVREESLLGQRDDNGGDDFALSVDANVPPPQPMIYVQPPSFRAMLDAMDINVDNPDHQNVLTDPNETQEDSDAVMVDIELPTDFMNLDDDNSVGNKSDASQYTCGSYFQCNEGPIPPDRVMQEHWKDYITTAKRDFIGFNFAEIASINLLDTLRNKKATLDTYNAIMEWHFRETGSLQPHQQLASVAEYYSRDCMLHKLALRYNMYPKQCLEEQMARKKAGRRKIARPKLHIIRPLTLPGSKSKIDLIQYNFQELVVQLLTDPRLTDEDMLHTNDDPLAPPPDNPTKLGDINTGSCVRETFRKLIKDPSKEMLCPVIWYVDGATVGQFVDHKIEQLKFTLGIFTREARAKDRCWATIGWFPNIRSQSTFGDNLFRESKHDSSQMMPMKEGSSGLNGPGSGQAKAKLTADEKAMDWNACLDAHLESYRQAERDGMVFDYQYKGILYKNLRIRFFTAFIMADTEEADKVAGKFGNRTDKVAQICRYCKCPNDESDSCVASHPYKTETEIKALIQRKDHKRLQKLSQRCLPLPFHNVCFGLHNNRGVHGATPIENLHQVLLGIFKYVLQCFFDQVGPSSTAAGQVDSLCITIGKLFARQSDRNLPKTNFTQGLTRGKLMGKEMEGVLLLLLSCLQTKAGQEVLSRGKSNKLKDDAVFEDWVMLLEALLTWELFLCEPEMDVRVVKRLKTKHQHLMYLCKKVMDRTTGRGMKLVKFHTILHLADDMMMFGVCANVDTKDCESHHKPTKASALRTQRDINKFEEQCATRVQECHILDLAKAEIAGNRKWEYLDPKFGDEEDDFLGYLDSPSPQRTSRPCPKPKTETKGTKIRVMLDTETMEPAFDFPDSRIHSRENVEWDRDVVAYLLWLQTHVFSNFLDSLHILTEHHRDGQPFRAHPNYRQQGSWYDWVMVNWGGNCAQPCQIWCFLDLSCLPSHASVQLDGVTIKAGVYAVVESAEFITNPDQTFPSRLFVPCKKEGQVLETGYIQQRRFYLADVEAFEAPACVIPDIGNEDILQYLWVRPRQEWAGLFIDWVNENHDPHLLDDEREALNTHRLEKKQAKERLRMEREEARLEQARSQRGNSWASDDEDDSQESNEDNSDNEDSTSQGSSADESDDSDDSDA